METSFAVEGSRPFIDNFVLSSISIFLVCEDVFKIQINGHSHEILPISKEPHSSYC